ncbi:MAG: aminotransferase class V-fold PLP-dependent enzyme [Phycisphaerales bacterium]|nr:aminotransferase class V-fold PLP-dependent enzyme [Phycisphaerales bacterium]
MTETGFQQAVIPESFAGQVAQIAAFIARYHGTMETRAVMPSVDPGAVFDTLPSRAPESAEPFDAIMADVEQIILPALAHWQHPMFFGYFPANASAPAMLADLLCAGLGVQGMLWQTSPACTELEMRVLDWLGELIALPKAFLFGTEGASGAGGGGVIQGTASEAVLSTMIAARAAHGGTSAPHHTVYASTQAHSSVVKAARMCGVVAEHVRLVPTSSDLAMDASALQAMINADIAQGRAPAFICATLGTTSTGAMDPLASIGPIAQRAGAWLHVDAAWAGSAFVCPELRAPMEGIEHADSFNFNPHKWLLTNFDCSCLWLNGQARREQLINAMSITPEYLRNQASESGKVVDYRDWHVPLGRRFRALKLWFVLRMFGAEGLREHIKADLAMAQWLESQVHEEPRLELLAPPSLALLCLAVKAADAPQANAHTRALHDWLRNDGQAVLTHTTVPDGSQAGRYGLRIAIGSPATTQAHVVRLWNLLQHGLDAVIGASTSV